MRGSATQAEFADRVGINVNTLRGYEKGRALPGYEVLESLCSKLNVSPSWILTGQGNVLQEAPFSGLNETPRPLPQPELAEPMPSCDVDLIMIPMVEARLSAGHGSLEVGGDSERSYAFRSDFLHRKGNPREMVLMRVSGDSMEPDFSHEDIALVQRDAEMHIGDIGVFVVNGNAFIKELGEKELISRYLPHAAFWDPAEITVEEGMNLLKSGHQLAGTPQPDQFCFTASGGTADTLVKSIFGSAAHAETVDTGE